MNTPRKNHYIFPCQDAPTPRNEVEVISLKCVLHYCLKHFLASEYEAEDDSFIDFSQNRKAHSSSEMSAIKNRDLQWHEIPLQKQQTNTEVLYATALPQLFAQNLQYQSNPTDRNLAVRKTTHSFIKKLQAFQLKPCFKDSLCKEETLRSLSVLWKSFKIESERPGWVVFRLSSRGIYAWIKQLQSVGQMAEENHTLVIKKLSPKFIKNSQALRPVNAKQQAYAKAPVDHLIWQAQYTHARCYSLMCYWDANSTQKNRPDSQPTKASVESTFTAFEALFHEKQSTPSHQLFQALISTVDDMFWLSERHPDKQYGLLLKRGELLHHAFDQFYRAHPPIANAAHPLLYKTLVSSTQNLLKLLLNTYLQVPAPRHL